MKGPSCSKRSQEALVEARDPTRNLEALEGAHRTYREPRGQTRSPEAPEGTKRPQKEPRCLKGVPEVLDDEFYYI